MARAQLHISGNEGDNALVAAINQAINEYKYKHRIPTKLQALAEMVKKAQ